MKARTFYVAKRVCTQADVGGGALHVTIAPVSGQALRLVQMYAQGTASAGAALEGYVYDEDGGFGIKIAAVPAGASRAFHLPSQGSAATATSNVVDSNGLIVVPGEYFDIYSSAALQNETLTLFVVFELIGSPATPTWGTTGSAGTPSLAASTISAANSIVAVTEP